MDFKFLLLLVFAINISCSDESSSDKNPNSGHIGVEATTVSNGDLAFNVGMVDEGEPLLLYDSYSESIQSFDFENLSIEWSVKYPNEQVISALLSGSDGSFAVVLENKSATSISKDGIISSDDLDFQGTPQSYAYDRESGYLVIYDDLGSVGMIKYKSDGSIESSLLLGPLLSDDQLVYAGDIDPSGNLFLSMNDKSLLKIDLAATIEAQSWVFETLYTNDEIITWLAPSQSSAGYLIATDNSKVLSIEVATGDLKDSLEFDDISSSSKTKEPHLVLTAKDAQETSVANVSEGGSLAVTSVNVPSTSLRSRSFQYGQRLAYPYGLQNSSYFTSLDMDEGVLSYISSSRFVSLRLSDSLVTASHDLDGGDLFVTPTSIVSVYDSVLGYLKKTEVEGGKVTELKAYNLPYLE